MNLLPQETIEAYLNVLGIDIEGKKFTYHNIMRAKSRKRFEIYRILDNHTCIHLFFYRKAGLTIEYKYDTVPYSNAYRELDIILQSL